ncbi:histidine kinase dimerization/phosphoacceptor domain -containing protein [Methyloferula stellata]|uniref:histidine kinase dimerization/phosphoacceptor domain -containing protein n=1 Tax=Methyloferula stellata TaxID=876270 RepID=UPI00036AA097|nr:histidine kinase dimerization/phosphoacceptor domain -containing protein [Methyloferula stellata]
MPPSPVSVLYVDDDPGLTRLIQRTLGRRGYSVEIASTTEEGLERIAKGGVDVVALDHFLPTGTGLDFLAAMRGLTALPAVVYVTGTDETAVAIAALKAGASDYVLKTVGEEFFELLGTAIDQAVEKVRLERERDRALEDMRQARDRAEILLNEVNHRVANSLSLIAGLVRMQARTHDDPSVKSALEEVQSRISAIAGVHRRLYTSEDVRYVELSGYLGSLLEELGATLKATGHASKVRFTADPITVQTDKAIWIGIVITELVTNAFKYAYPEMEPGEIRVQFREVGPRRVHLSVEDDGIGWKGEGPAKGTGLGSRIVSTTARSLGSSVAYEGTGGCRVSLEFEL